MIRRTFLILPKVGGRTERSLWQRGIWDWNDFMAAGAIPGISPERKGLLDGRLEEADRFLSSKETGYFSRMLPAREHWRLYDRLRDDAAFLDIETDGLGPRAVVTVVGVYRGGRSTTLVRGLDLTAQSLVDALQGCRILITFNGSSFDLPMLEREFPFTMPRVPHYDLRHACARVGLKGGLKSIERQLGMARDREVEFVTGEQAVYLWHAWTRRGSKRALEVLRLYNEADTQNMAPIADLVYNRLRAATLAPAEAT
jgi:uncharacterized protein YprB with RNaseH-like and TPR domain